MIAGSQWKLSEYDPNCLLQGSYSYAGDLTLHAQRRWTHHQKYPHTGKGTRYETGTTIMG